MLTDIGFIVGVGCGIVGVPVYILIIAIVIRSKSCSGSFFRLFIVTGIVNIIMEIDRIWMFYLPQYTCAKNCALSAWVKEHNWWVDGVLFIVNRHGLLIQFLLSTVVSCDRFIVICLQSRFKELWNSYHMVVVAICFAIPLVTTYPFFLGVCNVYFEYYPETDNYKQNYKCSIEPYYNKYVIGFRLVTTVLSSIFNFGVFLFFFLGKLKVSGTQRKTEMKLFVYSLTELVLQASATILSFFLDAWNDSHPSMYHVILMIVYYLTDAATILPPFVLLLTSKNVRQAAFPYGHCTNLPKSGDCQRFFGHGKKIPKDVKRHCGMCRQHGIIVETRGHLCQFKNCDCWKCKLVRQRRSIMSTQIRIRREQDKKFQRTTDVAEADVVPWNGPPDSNINMCYFCQKCKNHGVLMWKKDHKKRCEFVNCRCEQCDLIDTRRALDRHIKNNKNCRKDNSISSSSEVSSSNSPVDVESLAMVPAKPSDLKIPASLSAFPYLDPQLVRAPLPLVSPLQPSLMPIVPSLYSPLPIISPPILHTFPTYPFDLQLMLNLYQTKQF